ncbi:ATP-binding protein [Candidatus Entotheonella palauensis]|uniref:Orc1-like AAA ATPase domain-containing protein n=1 Tax=Candidatus Entotheonella gemina TaxID=1429439 RepID=W4LRK2_9BACT|nr:AAA family ATPase [Candidatus Entotheonella palauensis]ETX00022.1 MAG: hypothetical protein ETSY2_39850 [Candidatus Entotheonella gemina]
MNMPNFIGRESDLSHIDEQFFHVVTSQARVLLIEGIAGMGKSRLAEQIEARSERNGMRVATGRCYEDVTQPYTPFRSLLTYFEEEELLDHHGHSYLHVLTGHRLPSSNIPSAPDANPDMLLFMNLTQAILTLAARAPLVFIVEDLHWADPSTLDLFDYLAFALAEQGSVPLLLIGTYRPVQPATRLGNLLARLHPEPLVRSLILPGLNDVETRDLLRALGVRRPTQQLVRAVHEATQGVPLFVEEALRYLVRQGALYGQGGALSIRTGSLPSIELPSDLTNAISDRLRALPLSCQLPLTLAALLGETFQTEILQMMVTQGPEELAAAIEDGIEHGVLLREDTQLRFAHPLLRHAFYNRLVPLGRQRYHLQIARTFETLYADNLELHILDIAYHVVMAGPLAPPETVLSLTRLAADKAFGIFAWHEAARYYEAALKALESGAALSAQERVNLLYQAGVSHHRNQDVEPAKFRFEQAAQDYRVLGDISGLANTLTWLTMMSYMHNSLSMDVMIYLQQLHEVFEALGDSEPALSGLVMVVISQAYRAERQGDGADEYAQRALDIGRQANNDFVCSAALNALGLAHLGRLHVESAIQSWQESATRARSVDDPFQYSLPLLNLPLALNLKGMLEEAYTQALDAGEAARLIQDWSGYSKALSHLVSVSVAKGDYVAAEEHHKQTMTMFERSRYTPASFRSLQALSCALALRGLWDEANEALDMIIEPGHLFPEPPQFETMIVSTFKQLIRTYQAERIHVNVATLANELMAVVQYDTYSIAPLCAIIELGAESYNPAITEQAADMLAVAMERGVVLSSGWPFLVPRVLGLARLVHQEWEQAEELFQQALSIGLRIGARPELARTYYDFAKLLILKKEGIVERRAVEYLDSATQIFHELSMLPQARAVYRLKQNIPGVSLN